MSEIKVGRDVSCSVIQMMDVTIAIGSREVSRYRTRTTRALSGSEWPVRNSRELVSRVTPIDAVGCDCRSCYGLLNARHSHMWVTGQGMPFLYCTPQN